MLCADDNPKPSAYVVCQQLSLRRRPFQTRRHLLCWPPYAEAAFGIHLYRRFCWLCRRLWSRLHLAYFVLWFLDSTFQAKLDPWHMHFANGAVDLSASGRYVQRFIHLPREKWDSSSTCARAGVNAWA
jgi:hypothetical protein